ncbi:MAG: thiamine biosynthesis protein ThiF [Sulfurimonas sp.]|jgi:hypothetical protein
MIHGFDLESPLVCEGIVGDGCGGGRIFFIENETLYAHDPISKENRMLLQNIKKAKKISKSGCIVTIKCEDETMEFDLSQMQKK